MLGGLVERATRVLNLSVTLTLISVAPAWADDPPDEVNVPKYLNIFTEAKKISDAKRARANDLLSKAQAIDAQIRSIEDNIRTSTSSLQDKKELKARIEVENPQLAAANESLMNENRRSQADLDYNSTILQRLYGERRDLEYQIQREEQTAAQIWQRVDELNREVERLSGARNRLEREFEKARDELRDAEDRLRRSEKRLEEVNSGIVNAQNEIRQKEADLNYLRSQTDSLRRAANEAQSRYDSKRTELDPVQAKVERLGHEVNWYKERLREINQHLTNIDTAIRDVDGEISNRNSSIDRLQSEIDDLKRQEQTPEVIAQIEAKEREIAGLRSEISDYNEKRKGYEREQAETRAEFDRNNDELRGKLNEQSAARDELQRIKSALEGLEKQLQAARNALNQNTEQISKNEREIGELNQKINKFENARNELTRDIDQLNNWIPRQRHEVRELRERLENVSRRLEGAERERQAAVSDYDRQEQFVRRLQGEYRDLQDRIGGIEYKNNELDKQIRDNESQIARNQETIRQNVATLQQLAREIPDLENEIARLERSLPPLRNASDQAWAAFRPVDQDATEFEARTTAAYSKYLEVKAEYDKRMQAAKDSGSSQGDSQGRTDGTQKGSADGKTAGTQEGAAAGKREGLEFGYKQGQEAGTKQGDVDGYQHGLNLPANYNAGLELGLKQGDADAWEFARKTEYPKARADQRAEFFRNIPKKEMDLDNNQRPNPNSLQLNRDGGDSFFFSVASNKNLGTRAEGRTSFVTQVTASLAQPNCEFGWREFNEACVANYKASYQYAYDVSYKAAYNGSYSGAFKEAHDIAFDQNKTVRYEEGYKQTYPTAYAAGDKRGAQDAQNKGYLDGKKQGYARTIETAKATEYKKGIDDETALFASSPIVRLLSASMIEENAEGDPGELLPGDLLTLSVDTANFGAKDSSRGHVKVQWTALSNNVAVQSGVVDLTGIPAETRARVRNLGLAKISSSAAPGSEIKLKVSFTSDSGGYQEYVLTAVVAKGFASTVEEIKTEQKPKLGKTYDFEVKVRSQNAEPSFEDFRVELRTDEPANVVRLDVAQEINTKRLKPKDDFKAKKLRYTILDSTAVGRSITFKVVVFHGKNVTARSTISVVPKVK